MSLHVLCIGQRHAPSRANKSIRPISSAVGINLMSLQCRYDLARVSTRIVTSNTICDSHEIAISKGKGENKLEVSHTTARFDILTHGARITEDKIVVST